MLKYPCLVLDHDDTVVQTERAIAYPYFRDYLKSIRPHIDLTISDFVHACYNAVFPDMCRERWQFTDAELAGENENWQSYCATHSPPLCPGIENIVRRQKEAGGLICVVSLSSPETIRRDYEHHFGFQPDAIYAADLPRDRRKPNPWPLLDIMERFHLKPQEMLMVDDMKLGYTMAQAASISTACAAWAKIDFPELMAEMKAICDHAFDSPKELEDFLFEITM